jgi:hypothetical protein
VVNLKQNVEIVVNLGTSHSRATETEPEVIIASTVAIQAMTRRVASSSRIQKLKMDMPVIMILLLLTVRCIGMNKNCVPC